MNSVISKIFVFVTEVVSLIILFVGAIAVLVAGANGGPWAFGAGLLLLLLFILMFGFAAMLVENHKLLTRIELNTRTKASVIEPKVDEI